MTVAIVVFYLMGYQIPSIFVYLILFAGICELFSLQNTLVSNTVLVLHLYAAQSVHPALLVNELLLLLTGTSCGILMNLYMPGNSAKSDGHNPSWNRYSGIHSTGSPVIL